MSITLREKISENMNKSEYDNYYDLIEYSDKNGNIKHLPVPFLEGNFTNIELVKKANYVDIRNNSFFYNEGFPSFYKDYDIYDDDELEREYSLMSNKEKLNYVRLLINNRNYVYIVDYENLLI